jgi:hypothetical protein
MKPKDFLCFFRKNVSAIVVVIIGVFCETHLFAAAKATMTVYQNNGTQLVFNLVSIKNVTLGETTDSKLGLVNKIVHSIRYLPSSGNCKFNVSGAPRSLANLIIFNITGQVVYSKKLDLDNKGNGVMILPDITNGFYIVQLKNGLSTITQRMTIYR